MTSRKMLSMKRMAKKEIASERQKLLTLEVLTFLKLLSLAIRLLVGLA